ncbi:hypothetical protein ScalyP_jg9108 [Parmales sp. scaly parma]|nr:hypothetical protein ScalyP_jg9108 [Parmales sp. scaly parma]
MSTFLFLLTLFSTTNAYYIIPIRSKFHAYVPSRLHQTTPDGIFADKNFKAGDNLLSIPYESTITSANSVYKDFELRTGNNGVLALEILDALHSSSVTTTNQFVKSLPPPLSPEMRKFPILWSERQQSVLQQSSTNKIYDILDDLEDDFNSIQSSALAPFVTEDEFKWALCIARSQSVFADGELYLSPLLQFANYGDEKEANEVTAGPKTIFGDSKSKSKSKTLLLKAKVDLKKGEQIKINYGPKSAAEHLIDHGFVPEYSKRVAVAELSFAILADDVFYDDKVDVLQLNPVQKFDFVNDEGVLGKEAIPDPAMFQFLRLANLGQKDAFLLETIFRDDVWDFMGEPVSQANEMAVYDAVDEVVESHLSDKFGVKGEVERGGVGIDYDLYLKVFQIIDKDNSGQIDRDELKMALVAAGKGDSVGEEELDEMMSVLDVDRSGEVDVREFSKFMEVGGGEGGGVELELCAVVRDVEIRALMKLKNFIARDRQAIDLKKYYAERRLADLNLDQPYNMENSANVNEFGGLAGGGGVDF